MRFPHRGVAVTVIVLSTFYFTILVIDLFNLATDLETYRLVYGFTENDSSWFDRSPGRYVLASFLRALICLLGIALALRQLRIDTRANRLAFYFYLAAGLTYTAVHYVGWVQSGFDH